MQYYQCKCGNRTMWSSVMFPQPCQVCEECGSTMADHPDFHAEPEEHKWITRYNQNTGEPYEVCSACLERKMQKRNKNGIDIQS